MCWGLERSWQNLVTFSIGGLDPLIQSVRLTFRLDGRIKSAHGEILKMVLQFLDKSWPPWPLAPEI